MLVLTKFKESCSGGITIYSTAIFHMSLLKWCILPILRIHALVDLMCLKGFVGVGAQCRVWGPNYKCITGAHEFLHSIDCGATPSPRILCTLLCTAVMPLTTAYFTFCRNGFNAVLWLMDVAVWLYWHGGGGGHKPLSTLLWGHGPHVAHLHGSYAYEGMFMLLITLWTTSFSKM